MRYAICVTPVDGLPRWFNGKVEYPFSFDPGHAIRFDSKRAAEDALALIREELQDILATELTFSIERM